jgi:hypothetical protein
MEVLFAARRLADDIVPAWEDFFDQSIAVIFLDDFYFIANGDGVG